MAFVTPLLVGVPRLRFRVRGTARPGQLLVREVRVAPGQTGRVEPAEVLLSDQGS